MAKEKQKKQKGKKEEFSLAGAGKNKSISLRGRTFEGTVVKKFPKRIVVEFERTVYVQKYESFYRKKTRLHARLPSGINVNVGDYVRIMECRPLSKIIHFMLVEKVRDADAYTKQKLLKEMQDKSEKEKSREEKS